MHGDTVTSVFKDAHALEFLALPAGEPIVSKWLNERIFPLKEGHELC